MKVFLVGGAVRDALLGHPVKDKDYVVVGASVAQMLEQGYQQVGRDFPVFLHPKTQQEYALARQERKAGRGYSGFEVDASSNVTLEQDLLRRDLTINAMAMDEDGSIIDPYHGQQDLENRLLRHVSDAFVEDPLRVLRVARFAARYHQYGFCVADETLELMQRIAESGELKHLTAERVWQETARALMEPNPEVYFQILKQVNALSFWFAELDVLWGIPNPAKWHPEIDTGIHTLMVLQQAVALSGDLAVRFAALTHDLGKGKTPPDNWPAHHGHETLGLAPINALCDRIKAPNECRELALMASQFHTHVHKAFELKPATLLKVFNRCDGWRKPQRFAEFLNVCRADAKGRTGFENSDYPQADYVWQALEVASNVDVKQIIEQGFQGAQIKQQLEQARVAALSDFKTRYPIPH
ncbi:multifunctional CCA addition/repair protein [Neptunicella marina]|uniref:Multifunctional CCA protein n=1 Tax=Neptunicella marina TaxID=2125989 RepID=A0A8J6M837_9ALTE|nr:multifunctional CCA addition/repair protein [Neptunicella marina]MBC3767661.1 multifunctional CCA addition/repair protein [Neptunicella marina]